MNVFIKIIDQQNYQTLPSLAILCAYMSLYTFQFYFELDIFIELWWAEPIYCPWKEPKLALGSNSRNCYIQNYIADSFPTYHLFGLLKVENVSVVDFSVVNTSNFVTEKLLLSLPKAWSYQVYLFPKTQAIDLFCLAQNYFS